MAENATGQGSLIRDLLPVAVIGVMGYLAYTLLSGSRDIIDPSGTNNQVSQANTRTQASQNQNSKGSVSPTRGGLVTPIVATPNPADITRILQGIVTLPNIGPTLGGLSPGQFTAPGYSDQVYQGTGLGGLFVVAGPDTPTNFFPQGPVISVSQPVNAIEQQNILNNLLGSGITNAWWSSVQTITQTTQPGGLNSAGVFQSNIPVGTKHCPCPGPGCKPGDDWYYC